MKGCDDMAAFKNFPVPLKEKLVTVIFIAVFILFAGSVAAVVFKDIIMLILSLLLCVFNLIRAVSLYKTVSGNEYDIVEGRCTEISSVLIRKQKKIKIATEDGDERYFILDRRSKISVGKEYRFYFKATQKICFGKDITELLQSADCFLGYEEVKNE